MQSLRCVLLRLVVERMIWGTKSQKKLEGHFELLSESQGLPNDKVL